MWTRAGLFVCWLALAGSGLARPRLEVGSNQWTGTLKPGGQIGYQVKVVNRSREISRGVLCGVFLQGRKIGQVISNADLAPNAEVLLEGTVGLPGDLAEALQSKSPEQVMQFQLQPYRVADLCPADIAVETTTEGLRWVVTVVNKGAASAPSIPYRLLYDGKVLQQKKLLEAVGPGDSHQITYLDRRLGETGKHKLACMVDPDGEIEDSDPSNNQYQLEWQASNSKPDLSLHEWRIEPETTVVGAPVKVFFSLTNTGEIDLYKLPIALKVNDRVELEKKFFQALPPGGEAELFLTWVPTQAGDHKLRLVCQGQSTPIKTLIVGGRPGYKLQLLSASLPRRSPQGKDWVFDVVFVNQGSLPVDSVKAVLWIDGRRGWSARLSNPLPAGQEATLNLRWSAEEPGKHELRVELTGQGAKADENADVNKVYPVEVEVAR